MIATTIEQSKHLVDWEQISILLICMYYYYGEGNILEGDLEINHLHVRFDIANYNFYKGVKENI